MPATLTPEAHYTVTTNDLSDQNTSNTSEIRNYMNSELSVLNN